MHDDNWGRDHQNANVRDTIIRDTKNAIKLVRVASQFTTDLAASKLKLIKILREQEGIGLKEAKEAVELALELRFAA